MFVSKPKLCITATLLAKNESDIIGRNIEHHLNNGVTNFIVTDNGSSDSTRRILEKYPEVVEIIDEPGDDHQQSMWVTRMAKIACKLDPDWIVHLDADELWCGLSTLRHIDATVIGSTKMFLHPPTGGNFSLEEMSYYLDFESIHQLPGECKIAHRPDPEIMITHGNHGVVGDKQVQFIKDVWRHHYPVRTFQQLVSKAVNGHHALTKRNSICERWKKWHDLHYDGRLKEEFNRICSMWLSMISSPNQNDLVSMLEFWSTPEVIEFFRSSAVLPAIGQWPHQTLPNRSDSFLKRS